MVTWHPSAGNGSCNSYPYLFYIWQNVRIDSRESFSNCWTSYPKSVSMDRSSLSLQVSLPVPYMPPVLGTAFLQISQCLSTEQLLPASSFPLPAPVTGYLHHKGLQYPHFGRNLCAPRGSGTLESSALC